MTKNNKTGHRILVIDDEENLRFSFETLLERAGFGPVLGVATYDEAATAIKNHDFDIIVSDIVLEGASGIDLLRLTRDLGKTIPVVMITGYPNIDTAAQAVRLGAFDYLPKPVKKDELLRVTAAALEQLHLQREKELFEKEKEKSRYYQETILRSVREIIITFDPQLRVAGMNDMAREWTRSFMPEMAIGVYLSNLSCPVGKACFQDAKQVIDTRKATKVRRVEWPRCDDRQGVLSLTAAPLKDDGDNFFGVVVTARELTHLEDIDQQQQTNFHRLLGTSMAMKRVFALIQNVGQVDVTVLITGESGTGKELVAEALHAESPRKNRPLVKVDCTAIPEELLESELFGHKKGSFTGADIDRLGRILQADGGTLFLDEIGNISHRTQLRLLRFLQEQTFYPVGQDRPIQVDVRIITATNADLKEKVRNGQFREDLYFRLRVVDIMLPPLRERKGDVPLLAEHFLRQFRNSLPKSIQGFSDQAMEPLTSYHWPGNVRELEHVIERACVLCSGNTITTDHLHSEITTRSTNYDEHATVMAGPPPLPRTELKNEKERILYALQQAAGNKAKAARHLGIDRSTLYRKITLHSISIPAETLQN